MRFGGMVKKCMVWMGLMLASGLGVGICWSLHGILRWAVCIRYVDILPEAIDGCANNVLDTENYTDESRTLFFDNVNWYETDAGEDDGYETVAP
jgi:hypothetical protein